MGCYCFLWYLLLFHRLISDGFCYSSISSLDRFSIGNGIGSYCYRTSQLRNSPFPPTFPIRVAIRASDRIFCVAGHRSDESISATCITPVKRVISVSRFGIMHHSGSIGPEHLSCFLSDSPKKPITAVAQLSPAARTMPVLNVSAFVCTFELKRKHPES